MQNFDHKGVEYIILFYFELLNLISFIMYILIINNILYYNKPEYFQSWSTLNVSSSSSTDLSYIIKCYSKRKQHMGAYLF